MTITDTSYGHGNVAMPRDYFMLLKPRVMSLVIFTAFVGMYLAPDGMNPALGAAALIAIAIGAGASGALNMWYDADIDALMERTADRPVPSGVIQKREALAFGVILSGFSVAMLGLFANWLAAGLLAFTILFYAVIYTIWLKRWTAQNIVIGGAAGALPPVIGWAAVTGGFSVDAWLMFLIIFLWTPPHFWALALLRAQDYRRAAVPMLPNTAGERSTRRQIFLYCVLLAISGLLPAIFGSAGVGYAICALLLGLLFLLDGWKLLRADGEAAMRRAAGKLFGFSIIYLFLIFAGLLGEAAIRDLFANG